MGGHIQRHTFTHRGIDVHGGTPVCTQMHKQKDSHTPERTNTCVFQHLLLDPYHMSSIMTTGAVLRAGAEYLVVSSHKLTLKHKVKQQLVTWKGLLQLL